MTRSYDCIVVGGGPAGSTAAALLAAAGCSTLLVERERVPRNHVGGILAPACRTTLSRLGLLDAVSAAGHARTPGVEFLDHAGQLLWNVRYDQVLPPEEAHGWHVSRADFDRLLFEKAACQGADCRDRTRVLEVLFDDRRAIGVRLQGPAEMHEENVRARVVIDASGQQSLLAGRCGLREACGRLRQAAVWTCYRGGRRTEGLDGGASLVLRTASRRSWFWYAPLAGDLVSVGVVGQADYLHQGRGKPESIFEEQLVACPAVAERLIDAQLADDFRTAADFGYSVTCPAGDGWVLAGDAGGFVDPLFHQGVWLAMRSGERAADAAIAGLGRGDASAEQLGGWTAEHASGVERLRRLVYAFQTEGFCPREFTDRHPEHQRALVSMMAGGWFDPSADLPLADVAARQPAIESSPLN